MDTRLYRLGAGALVGLALIALPALATEPDRGRMLYENHCLGCHESRLHIREDRQMDSIAGLRAEIRRWGTVQELKWRQQDVEDVLDYLNEHYYRLTPEP